MSVLNSDDKMALNNRKEMAVVVILVTAPVTFYSVNSKREPTYCLNTL